MTTLLSLGNFYGIDSLIDFFIVVVSLLIFYQSRKIYKLSGEKNFNYFSFAFLGIAIAYFFKILINLTFVYYTSLATLPITTCLHCVIENLEITQLISIISMALFKIFLIGGFLILFLITNKKVDKNYSILFGYFSGVIILASLYFDFVFNLTIVFILVSLLIHFYKNYQKTKSQDSKIIFLLFIPILFSNLLGIFYPGGTVGYLFEEILLFIGFITLFLLHSKFRTKNEKTNKARGN